ncbi:hypothetical protein QTO34_016493 [Cnephaeus nilssonii]|uniref:Deoxycytidylate deaminase n=1 Tax=Cnephaeus nilssonii TaxID=3371016 RepID=A0AA40LS78_CNENI|nr:hypothetical protein QTO34_016493 [Eptesicus nilssonii]
MRGGLAVGRDWGLLSGGGRLLRGVAMSLAEQSPRQQQVLRSSRGAGVPEQLWGEEGREMRVRNPDERKHRSAASGTPPTGDVLEPRYVTLTGIEPGPASHRPSMSDIPCKKREDYLEWPEYFMAVAFLPSPGLGACFAAGGSLHRQRRKQDRGIGYNGMPNGCSDDLLPWRRTAERKLDTKYPYVCHAELNAIMNKNSADVKGCTIYVALFPCNECAKLIIQAGIKEVIFMSDKYHDSEETTAARLMFDMAGVAFRKFTPKCSKIVIDFDSINSRPSQKLP